MITKNQYTRFARLVSISLVRRHLNKMESSYLNIDHFMAKQKGNWFSKKRFCNIFLYDGPNVSCSSHQFLEFWNRNNESSSKAISKF